MKINLLLVLILLMFFSGCRSQRPISASVICQQQCKLDVPRIVFVSTEHDFGKVDAGSQNTCTFEFINDGNKDLIIENVYASCGCTVTCAADTIIKPGQASEIAVNFHAGYSGKSKKQITVVTNDPQNREVKLWLSAEAISADQSSSPQLVQQQPATDSMPTELRQVLRNVNKATN